MNQIVTPFDIYNREQFRTIRQFKRLLDVQSLNVGKVVSTDGTQLTWSVGGSGGAWGSITGTLSAQTDLQTALDNKLSTSSFVASGSNTQIQFNSSGTFAGSASLTWNGTTVGVTGNISATSANTTQVTTAASLAVNANSLTTGTGFYAASSSLTSGILANLQVSGTAAATNQTGLNILVAGATSTSAVTSYGAQISNTRTNATSGTNVALYLNASGATTNNYGLLVNAGSVGIGTITPTTGKLVLADTALAGSGALAGSILSMTQTWNTTGNPTAIFANITNTASGASASLIDLQVGGTSVFKVSKAGTVSLTGQVLGASSYSISGAGVFGFASRSVIASPSDGVLTLWNAANTDFARVQFGGTTSSFPSIKRNATAIDFRLADDSAYAPINTANITATGQIVANKFALTDGATIAIDFNNSNVHSVTLAGNRTITFANPKSGAEYTLLLTQDATGSRTITWPTIKWSGGSAPTLTTTATKTDIITLWYDGTSYYGSVKPNY